MPIRDMLIFGAFAAIVPMVLFHPYIGALLWVLFGLLNPHRLAYGSAYEFPFALVIGIVTLIGIALTRDHRQLKGGAAGVVLVVLMLWMTVTTIFALTPDAAWEMWWRVTKVLVMTFVLMFLLNTKRHLDLLLAAIVFSIAFYGVKGGIFTVLTGGSSTVLGPNNTLLESNNHLGVANVMTIPLLAHYYQQVRTRWMRWGLLACILFTAAAVLGSYSRGAVLALAAMGLVLWWRSSYKTVTLILALIIGLVLIPFMPERWDTRRRTLETYEHDVSAMSRINSCTAAGNRATDRVLGAGFEYPTPEVIAKYSPATDISVAHSIYFQALGEHGFIGLGLFLLFWGLVWRQCSSLRKQALGKPQLKWAASMMSMMQASLIGYAVGGAFINIAFWDLPYYLYAAIVVTQYVVQRQISTADSVAVQPRRAERIAHVASSPTPRRPGSSVPVEPI